MGFVCASSDIYVLSVKCIAGPFSVSDNYDLLCADCIRWVNEYDGAASLLRAALYKSDVLLLLIYDNKYNSSLLILSQSCETIFADFKQLHGKNQLTEWIKKFDPFWIRRLWLNSIFPKST